MSFQNKSLWTLRDAGCSTDGQMGYDNPSRIEPKRAHHWLMDASEQELFCNKKQAIEAVKSRPMPGMSNVDISPLNNTSSFQSVQRQFTDRLFGTELVRTFSHAGNISSIGTGNLNMKTSGFENQFGNDSLVCLSMSHAMEDPSSLGPGVRKVKVSQGMDSGNGLSVPMGHPYDREDNNGISTSTAFDKIDNSNSLGQTYNNRDGSRIPIGPIFSKAEENFIPMGQTFDKGDGKFMLMGHHYTRGADGIVCMSQVVDRGDGNFISVNQHYVKGDGNITSVGPAYNKGHENFIEIGPTYNTANENFIFMGCSSDKRDDSTISMGTTHDKADTTVMSVGPIYNKEASNILSMGQNYNKGEGTTISFGVFQDEPERNDHDPSGRIISNYDLLMSYSSVQASEAPGQRDSVDHNVDPVPSLAIIAAAKTDTVPKNKEQKMPKKVAPNNFPSNVKSLLSTGMLDGVPVKYVSWSREKSLRGVIKGTGYLCGCIDCKLCTILNAYEFERHAGCKTKHPNNHIYFENGKTIYAVVQELKSSPQEMLFDAIQNVTGSPINQKNFHSWKVSYQAATLELQRIYGKDEVPMPS